MSMRIATLSVVILLGVATLARADKLHLKDGSVLSGKVTKEKLDGATTYTIVTDSGETLTFPKDEVKKFIYEASASDLELEEMYEQWQDIVMPALEAAEPNQREFLVRWRMYYGRLRSDLWLTPPSSDKFVHEWARYTAAFEAVARNHDYKQLMKAKKGSNSLREYVLNPPVDRKEIAAVLKQAVNVFERCIEQAKITQNLIKALPKAHIGHVKAVRRARDRVAKFRREVSTAKGAEQRRSRGQRAADARSAAERRHSKMHSDLDTKTLTADTLINDFARERVVAREQIRTAWEHLERLGARESKPAQPAVEAQADLPELPSGRISQEFRQLVDDYMAKEGDLTSIGRKALREDTLSGVERLFVGKQFRINVSVRDIKELRLGGYALIGDHGANRPNAVVRTVELQFAGEVRQDLIRCKVGAQVELVVRIRKANVNPPLEKAVKREEPLSIHLVGDVMGVSKGCDW